MSRNLGRTNCAQCASPVRLEEAPSWYDCELNTNFRKATCTICGTKYAAWMAGPDRIGDLSYLSTLNDEPGDADIPYKTIETLKLIVVDGVPFVIEHDFY